MLVKMKSLILIGLSKLLSAYYFAIIKRIYFHVRHGKIPKGLNFNSPKTFNEKINYLKLYNKQDNGSLLADKIEVKEFVKKIIGEEYLIPSIKTFETVEEIIWDDLPSSFVIKATHSSGMNFICPDKNNINTEKVIEDMKNWLTTDYTEIGGEWQYNLTPRLICEEYLENTKNLPLLDYKFLCFNGKPIYIQVDIDRFSKHTRNIYDLNWNLQSFTFIYENSKHPINKPKKLEEMIHISEKLSQGFPLMRVDLYSYQNRIYFGELTFHPDGGCGFIRPYKFDKILGNLINLN